MLFSDLMQETYFSLAANKSRSALTILGIVIGIGSVIAMVSIGQGASQSISQNIESLGSNLLVVMPGSAQGVGQMVRGGSGSAETLTLDDAEAIRKEIGNIDSVAPVVSSRKQIIYRDNNTNTNIYGVDENYQPLKSLETEFGMFINANYVNRTSKAAVLGPTTRDALFGESVNPVGQKIKIGNSEFSVVGVTVAKGGSGFSNTDDIVYIPLSTAQRYFTGSDSVSSINVQVKTKEMMAAAQEEITSLLLLRHKIKDSTKADFSIMNQTDIISAMSEVTGALTLLLGSIAGISLVVGGIGIMNMMLTTVSERTREIGLRKSLGAKKSDISFQFLAEAAALTIFGGILGVLFGWLASMLIGKLGSMNTSVTLSSVLLAFLVSAGIGLVFGYYPARKAAKLDPIRALRYE